MPRVRVYARLRPTNHRYEGIEVQKDSVKIAVGRKETEKFAGPQYTEHDFKFQRVFDEGATQEEVYDEVVCHMVDRFLEGYNGTIFAYGQTASGKTYTIEGSARRFAERGIIPRVLSHIYSSLEQRAEEENASIHISFMEIYQDTGYDLLNPGTRGDSLMITLPKVSVMEDSNGESMVRNLSTHLASTEEVALSLLFQGCTCRRVADTTMNTNSSRSHAVFTIMLTTQKPGSEVITRSKLHLVDLAGSERVAKTGADGRVLQEAKYINLSLHHLEHMIVILQRQALRERGEETPSSQSSSSLGQSTPHRRTPQTASLGRLNSRQRTDQVSGGGGRGGGERVRTPQSRAQSRSSFVPYRNSLLTMTLRDSLGGNCLTAMIATMSAEEENIQETISTCRFAQRVACISNKARRNEVLDDKAVIRKLRKRIMELENEVSLLRQTSGFPPSREGAGDSPSTAVLQPLNAADKKRCHQVLYDFLHGRISNPVAAGIDTPTKFQECLLVLKDVVLHAIRVTKKSSPAQPSHTPPSQAMSTTRTKSGRAESEETLTKKPCDAAKSREKQQQQQASFQGVRKAANDSLSPSPCAARSQLSSGFVSLLEEEATIQSPARTPSLSPVAQATQQPNRNADNKSRERHKAHGQSPVYQKTSPSGKQVTPATPQTEDSSLKPVPSKPLRVEQSYSHPSTSPRKKVGEESQALRSEVESLNLRVQEENLRREIAMVDEQLAVQHAKVLRLDQTGVASAEELLSERIAEKQLKIKQTRLNQKLVEVQHHQKLRAFSMMSHTLSPASTLPLTPSQQSSRYTYSQGTRIQHEDRQQTKEELEELRLLQMEKQLELKEAATRRRLLTLKQQLQNEAAATNSSIVSPSHHQTTTSKSSAGKREEPNSTYQKQIPSITPTLTGEPVHGHALSSTSPRADSSDSTIKKPPPQRGHVITVSLSDCSSSAEREMTSPAVRQEVRYMTALKQQKARVARMRQCMAAASIIQRAWRRHRRRRKSYQHCS